MMPYKGTYIRLFSAILKKPMKQMYGRDLTKKALKGAVGVYREMLNGVDDIGKDNPMAGNIYMGFVFLAIWKAADGELSVDDIRDLTKEFMKSRITKKLLGKRDLNDPENMKKLSKRFNDMKAWADEHPQYKDSTWDFNFDETKHRDGVYYHFTKCPLEKYAREHGFIEALPAACEIDFLTCANQNGVLHRQYTLAQGGKICDYWIVPNSLKDPR